MIFPHPMIMEPTFEFTGYVLMCVCVCVCVCTPIKCFKFEY